MIKYIKTATRRFYLGLFRAVNVVLHLGLSLLWAEFYFLHYDFAPCFYSIIRLGVEVRHNRRQFAIGFEVYHPGYRISDRNYKPALRAWCHRAGKIRRYDSAISYVEYPHTAKEAETDE